MTLYPTYGPSGRSARTGVSVADGWRFHLDDFFLEAKLGALQALDLDVGRSGPGQFLLDPAIEKLMFFRKLC